MRTSGARLNISGIPDLSFEYLGLIYHRSMVAKDSLANLVVERRAHLESSRSNSETRGTRDLTFAKL